MNKIINNEAQVALIIIYNHQYNDNIDKLELIYKDRFQNIYHLVPFYQGNHPRVIAVYESSYYFQGYIAQGFKLFEDAKYQHYFFVADDMIVNPRINDTNYKEHLKLNLNTSFIPRFRDLHENNTWWKRVADAFDWSIDKPGVEAKNYIPRYELALKAFNNLGLDIEPLTYQHLNKNIEFPKYYSFSAFKKYLVSKINRFKYKDETYNLPYPMVSSYSDIFVVSKQSIKQFCHLCGVFASTNLFVEFAIPTSLALTAKDIVTEDDLELKGKALWGTVALKELDVYESSLKKLIDNFPASNLYLHPVKLSKWKMDL